MTATTGIAGRGSRIVVVVLQERRLGPILFNRRSDLTNAPDDRMFACVVAPSSRPGIPYPQLATASGADVLYALEAVYFWVRECDGAKERCGRQGRV